MTTRMPLLLMLIAGCDRTVSNQVVDQDRDGCVGEDTGGSPPPPTDIPTPTATCPEIVDGDVTFCPGALMSCRDVHIVNASGATGSGPLAMHWHGTGEDPDGLLSWDTAVQAIESMVVANDGLLALPRADAAAVARSGNPFPWWVVCGDDSPSQCHRPDDFILADEIVACAVEQGLVDPNRLTSSGFSAGAIMTAHLVDRVDYLAGAVSWSGGLPEDYQPTSAAGDAAVLALHGGEYDGYCGSGVSSCYGFTAPTEAFALDVSNGGDFAFVCDHQAGHSAAMGNYGAAFLRDSDKTGGHAWTGYPFGYPGTGSDWMLNLSLIHISEPTRPY